MIELEFCYIKFNKIAWKINLLRKITITNLIHNKLILKTLWFINLTFVYNVQDNITSAVTYMYTRFQVNCTIYTIHNKYQFKTMFMQKWFYYLYLPKKGITNLFHNLPPPCILKYRVSHETWQMMNIFNCLLP